MRLTPWLLEAIGLLSLPKMELIVLLRRKMEDNAFLEREIDASEQPEAPIECDLLAQRVDGVCKAAVNREGLPRLPAKSIGGRGSSSGPRLCT